MDKPAPEVAILLCTYNGATYLPEQLASYNAQTHKNWSLWVNDDGSTDATRTLIEQYKTQNPQHAVTLFEGPRSGFVRNFLSLAARPEITGDYFAFSDQDDLWEPEKLARAVAWLAAQPADIPALYCARTLYVTHDNQPLYPSALFTRPPSFRNALVQSIAGANTMVFNRAARMLLLPTAHTVEVPSHDWWLYLLVSGAGGRVFYDPEPALRYRQHSSNLQGENVSLRARLARLGSLLAGKFRQWNDGNLQALQEARASLSPENQRVFDRFVQARRQGLVRRMNGLYRAGVYRQTVLDNAALALAALLNRL